MRKAVLWLLLFLTIDVTALFAQEREITNIAGDLYRFKNNRHYSVFLVTPEGVVATDPISKEAASWLKEEIKNRFNQPIKYLIYSHDHADHISGGEVFDEATVIGHELTKEKIISANRPTAVPDITFKDRMTIELGGKTVELIYPGKSHSDNCIVVNFPAEKTIFVVDFITVKRLPYQTLRNSFMPDWVNAIEVVESIDFDIVAPGHEGLGTKQDVMDHRQYLKDLYAIVLNANESGQSLEEMKASISMEEYRSWGQYENWLPLNIEGMYKMIQANEK